MLTDPGRIGHVGGRPEDWQAPGAALVRSAATGRIPALSDFGRVRIMGIAGSGMSELARILFDRRVPVSGCEAGSRPPWPRLRALGGDVVIGHSPRYPDDTGTFVFTTAVNPGTRNSPPHGRAARWSCAGPSRRKTAGASR